jgi:hypothetical protein
MCHAHEGHVALGLDHLIHDANSIDDVLPQEHVGSEKESRCLFAILEPILNNVLLPLLDARWMGP